METVLLASPVMMLASAEVAEASAAPVAAA